MGKNIEEIRAKMDPARRERNRLRAEEIIVAIELADLRKRQGVSQKKMAELLNVKRPRKNGTLPGPNLILRK